MILLDLKINTKERVLNQFNNPNKKNLYQPIDVGIRNNYSLVDFVGHLWCFKKKWLYNMFSIEPQTLETSEDMHFCFSNKVRDSIKSYVAKQLNIDESADLKILASKKIYLTKNQAQIFYEVHKERPFFNSLVEYMTSGPCLLYTSPSPRDLSTSRMPSSA